MPDSILHMLSGMPRDRHAPRDGQNMPVPTGHDFALHMGPQVDLAVPGLTLAEDAVTAERPTPEDALGQSDALPQDVGLATDTPPHTHPALFFADTQVAQVPSWLRDGADADNIDTATAQVPSVREPGAAARASVVAGIQLPVQGAAAAYLAPLAKNAQGPHGALPGLPGAATSALAQPEGSLAATAPMATSAPAPGMTAQTPLPGQVPQDALVAAQPRRKIAPVLQSVHGSPDRNAAKDGLAAARDLRTAPIPAAGTGTSLPHMQMVPIGLPSIVTPQDTREGGLRGAAEMSGAVGGLTGAPASVAGGQPAASPVATAPAPTAQVAQALAMATTDSFEISLSPEELGRVRIHLQPTEAGVQVLIQTERSETLELLRKNIALLSRELEDLGFEDLSFQFSQNQQEQRQNTQRLGTLAASGEEAAPLRPVAGAVAATLLHPARGIDLRF